jgi:hypothetical protein
MFVFFQNTMGNSASPQSDDTICEQAILHTKSTCVYIFPTLSLDTDHPGLLSFKKSGVLYMCLILNREGIKSYGTDDLIGDLTDLGVSSKLYAMPVKQDNGMHVQGKKAFLSFSIPMQSTKDLCELLKLFLGNQAGDQNSKSTPLIIATSQKEEGGKESETSLILPIVPLHWDNHKRLKLTLNVLDRTVPNAAKAFEEYTQNVASLPHSMMVVLKAWAYRAAHTDSGRLKTLTALAVGTTMAYFGDAKPNLLVLLSKDISLFNIVKNSFRLAQKTLVLDVKKSRSKANKANYQEMLIDIEKMLKTTQGPMKDIRHIIEQ